MARKKTADTDVKTDVDKIEEQKRKACEVAETMLIETGAVPSVRKLFERTGEVYGTCIDYNIVTKAASEFRQEVANRTTPALPEVLPEDIPQDVTKANDTMLKMFSIACGRIRTEEQRKGEILRHETEKRKEEYICWLRENFDDSARRCSVLENDLDAARSNIKAFERTLVKRGEELAAARANCEMLEKLASEKFSSLVQSAITSKQQKLPVISTGGRADDEPEAAAVTAVTIESKVSAGKSPAGMHRKKTTAPVAAKSRKAA